MLFPLRYFSGAMVEDVYLWSKQEQVPEFSENHHNSAELFLMLSMLGKIFSRRDIEIIFFFFHRK